MILFVAALGACSLMASLLTINDCIHKKPNAETGAVIAGVTFGLFILMVYLLIQGYY